MTILIISSKKGSAKPLINAIKSHEHHKVIHLEYSELTSSLISNLGIIDVVIDDNPEKCGKFLYGTHVPIVSKSEFEFKDGDLVIPLAWIHSKAIADTIKNMKEKITCLQFYPSVQICSSNSTSG